MAGYREIPGDTRRYTHLQPKVEGVELQGLADLAQVAAEQPHALGVGKLLVGALAPRIERAHERRVGEAHASDGYQED